MSAPAWLLDVIHSIEPASVPTVPNLAIPPGVRSDSQETLINKGFESNIPNVLKVLTEISMPQENLQSEAIDTSADLCDMNGGVDTEFEHILCETNPATFAKLEREHRHAKVRALLSDYFYVVIVGNDSTDPVIATVGIQDVATFEMAIPHHSYNRISIFEILEKYSEGHMNFF